MQGKFIKKILLFVAVVGALPHLPWIAQEVVKQDTAVASEVTGKPTLVVPEWYFNFGEVKEGTEYLHAFVVRNAGTGVLEIKKVQPG